MTNKKDAVSHPYDWVDPQAEYWATHGQRLDDLELEQARKKMEEKRAIYDDFKRSADSPWSNGSYALAAVVWGLILLVVFGVGAGP